MARAIRIARFLFPQRHDVESESKRSCALHHLNELHFVEVLQQKTKGETAADHANQQHHIHQRHHTRARLNRRKIGRQRQSRRLRRLHARANQQERQSAGDMADPQRPRGVARQNQQSERHDRQAAKLQQRAKPEIRHAAPAQIRAMMIGPETTQRTERRKHQRQRNGNGDQPCGDAKLNDHHAVERANHQRHRHADGDLKQRQAQQTRQRQIR